MEDLLTPVRYRWTSLTVPTLLALVWLSPLASDHSAGPFLAQYVALAAVVVLAAIVAWRPSPPARALAILIGVSVTLLLVLGFATLHAQSFGISAIGRSGGHVGWILWFTVVCWGLAIVSSRALLSLQRSIRTIAVLGGLATLAAVADKFGLLSATTRYSVAPSGLFENSLSLGQTLIICGACATAWGLQAKTLPARGTAVALVGFIGTGMWLAHSTGAFVGAAAALLTFGVLSIARHPERGIGRLLPILWFGTLALASAVMVGLTVVRASTGLAGLVQRASHERAAIWRSAFAQFLSHPWLGKGPEQFSAWVSWSTSATRELQYSAAQDPHNIALYWLVAGGVLALGIFVALVTSLALRLLDAEARSRGLAVRALVAGLVGWMVALQFTWITPIAGVTAVALIAQILALANPPRPDAEASPRLALETRSIAIILAGICVLLLALLAKPLAVDLAWYRVKAASSGSVPAEIALSSWNTWADPAYSTALLENWASRPTLSAADSASMKRVLAATEAAASWDVDTALLQIEFDRPQPGSETDWARFTRALDRAKVADPTSAIWDYIGAVEAKSLGRTADSQAFARAALNGRPPESAIGPLDSLAQGR